MEQLAVNVDLAMAGVVIAVVQVVAAALKRSPVKDWLIPIAALVVGSMLYPALVRSWAVEAIVVGFLAGASVVGLHQALWKQPGDKRREDGQANGKPGPDILGNLRVAFVVATLSGAMLLGTGCATSQTGGGSEPDAGPSPTRVAHVASLVRMSAKWGAYFAVKDDPAAASYFEAVAQVVRVVIASVDYSPERLRTALKDIPVKELREPEAAMVLDDVLTEYETHFRASVGASVDRSAWLRPVLDGLLEGVEAGVHFGTLAK